MQHPCVLTSLVLAVLAPAAVPAADFTVAPRRFEVLKEFECLAVPVPAEPLVLRAKEWGEFKISTVLPHGTAVKKGDVLVDFEDQALDRKLDDARRGVKQVELALANARTALTAQQAMAPLQLAAATAAAERAAADLEDFRAKRRPAAEESAREELKRAKLRLESDEEELKQLLAMYQADDLTEDTEEFILKRQRDAVAAGKFYVRMQELETARTLEVELPRKAEDLERAAAEAAITLAKVKQETPRALEAKKLEAEAAQRAHERAAADLSQLEADAGSRVLKAPCDGTFYHGYFRDGQWTTGDLVKLIVEGGVVPLDKPFATVVPKDAKLQFAARVEQADAAGLAAEAKASVKVAGFDDHPVAATITTVTALPGTDGRFLVELAPAAAPQLPLTAGMKAKASVSVYQAEAAMVVPAKAVKQEGESATVEVRLAEGGTQPRPVKTGRRSGADVEILSGLEAGQAIVVPE
jgi:multidrug resistance efflux pump